MKFSRFLTVALFGVLFLSNAEAKQPTKAKTATTPSVAPTLADTVERLLPSVVSISATQTEEALPNSALRGSPFESFFKENDVNPETKKKILLGSGFFYGEDGYILTSSHIVQGLKKVNIISNDGSVSSAEVIAMDKKTDIALLKTEGKHPAVKLGNSDKLRIGDSVIAIGNPFGLGNTVTAGIVSARSRDIQVGPYDDFIQTDAAINKGNSGGPLFNYAGELMGINTAIFSPSGGSVGIAFASPTKTVKYVADNLIKYKTVRRSKLGLKIQKVTDAIAKGLNLPKKTGVYVSQVNNVDTKLKEGDVILEFNKTPVTSLKQIPKVASTMTVGTVVNLTVWRDAKKITLPLKLMELKDEQELKNVENAQWFPISLLGLKASELTPEIRKKNNISKSVSGIMITEIDEKSDALAKGLIPGDIIVELDKIPQTDAQSVAHWFSIAAEMGQDSSFIQINRSGELFYVLVRFQLEGKYGAD